MEGLEVIVKYHGAKHTQVAAKTSSSAVFAILKKDLLSLRVHIPSENNVRFVDGFLLLHWPLAGPVPKKNGPVDSLYSRWIKLCSGDRETRKLRERFSIGVLICSTKTSAGAKQDASRVAHAERLAQQPQPQQVPKFSTPTTGTAKTLTHPLPPTPKLLPSPPKIDKQVPIPPRLKRRLSQDSELLCPVATRRKLDTVAPDVDMKSTNSAQVPTGWNEALGSLGELPNVQVARDNDVPASPVFVPPASCVPLPVSMHVSAPIPAPMPTSMSTPSQPGFLLNSQQQQHTMLLPGSGPASPALVREPGEVTPRTCTPLPGSSPRRDCDAGVGGLVRDLWDTRREMTTLQAREKVILSDLERLGACPPDNGSGVDLVSRDELARLEAELEAERTKRVNAERALNDVRRECRLPFVVPALLEALMSISELSG